MKFNCSELYYWFCKEFSEDFEIRVKHPHYFNGRDVFIMVDEVVSIEKMEVTYTITDIESNETSTFVATVRKA